MMTFGSWVGGACLACPHVYTVTLAAHARRGLIRAPCYAIGGIVSGRGWLFGVELSTANMRVLFVTVVLLLAFCTGLALSFSTGAPQEACTTVAPNHPPATPQNTTNPYRIDLSAFDNGGGGFTYLPGRTYQCEFGE